MEVLSHVVFTLKDSRYDFDKVRRKKPAGYLSPTYPFIEGKEEEILVEEICNVAIGLNLQIHALNFCGDHVHCIIWSKTEDLSTLMRLWKGKISCIYNRRLSPDFDNKIAVKPDGTKQAFWAKSYYQKILLSYSEVQKTMNYIVNNRLKHGLKPLSISSISRIEQLIKKR
jgi:REP element-mobilizing transposase RayT